MMEKGYCLQYPFLLYKKNSPNLMIEGVLSEMVNYVIIAGDAMWQPYILPVGQNSVLRHNQTAFQIALQLGG